MKACIFLADGFEEMEAVGVIDILRRGEVDVRVVSICENLEVLSDRNLKLVCDDYFKNIDCNYFDCIIFPGGMNGVNKIKELKEIHTVIKEFNLNGKYICAICAAPMILDEAGILNERRYTCYKGVEKLINSGMYIEDKVCVDGNIITSDCVGSTFEFGFNILEILKGKDIRDKVSKQMIL